MSFHEVFESSLNLDKIKEEIRMNVDPKDANVLLNQKYDKPEEGREIPQLKKTSVFQLPLANTEESKYWKMIAEERLQVMNQLRDQMNAWWEAYKVEKLRGDRLEGILLQQFKYDVKFDNPKSDDSEFKEPQEVKHTVNTRDQVNTRRARWPEIKKNLETLHRDFGEAGESKKEDELKDYGA